MSAPVVYDKAKYHHETVHEYGLDEQQASVHTAFFLAWLINNDLMSDQFAHGIEERVDSCKRRATTPMPIYEWWDCCLVDDMLSDEGNEFAQSYFAFETGQYLSDYAEILVNGRESEFHVPFTWENYDCLSARIDQRYRRWKRQRAAWWRRLLP